MLGGGEGRVCFKAHRTVVRGALLIAAEGGCCGSRVINSSSRSLVVGGARSIYLLVCPSSDCADGKKPQTLTCCRKLGYL